MRGRRTWLAVSQYLKKRPIRAGLFSLALALVSVWIITAKSGWYWISDTSKLPCVQVSFGRGLGSVRVWGDRPTQAVRDDSWFVGGRSLPIGLGYGGTYQPPGTMLLHGVHYDLYIPSWLPTALFALPTMLLVLSTRRTSAQIPCACCGYDLHGNESGTCPAFGTKLVDL